MTDDKQQLETAHVPRKQISGPLRYVLLAIGFIATGLGIAGFLLPVIPGVPFLLIAAWAFSLSSERFENWLTSHPIFGPMILDWRAYQVIPTRAKILATVMMGLSLAYLFFGSSVDRPIVAIIGIILALVSYYIWTRPSQRPEGATATYD